MLDDFEKDMGGKKGSREKGMALLLRHYEEELKRPIRNMFSGHLPRSALIQVRPRATSTCVWFSLSCTVPCSSCYVSWNVPSLSPFLQLSQLYRTVLHGYRCVWGKNALIRDRTIGLQVHKMKTDLEAAMIELDKIMRANELTVAVTAALPAIVIAGALSYVVYRAVLPHPPNAVSYTHLTLPTTPYV